MQSRSRFASLIPGVLGCCVLALASAAPAGAANVTIFNIPTTGSAPTELINGPDGRLWFTESAKHEVGRIDPRSLSYAPIPLPYIDDTGADDGVVRIARSANGYVWALDNGGEELYRVGADGSHTQIFPHGGGQGNDGQSSYDVGAEPDQLVPAAGGGAWTLFDYHNPDLPGNGYNGASIVGDDGQSHLVTNQTYEDPHPGALAPDGALWIVDHDYVTRIAANGAVGPRLPSGLDATYDVSSAAFGPDGSLWFTGYVSGSWFTSPQGGVLGHVVGNQVQLTKLNAASAPTSLRVGPDGALWWAETLAAPAGSPQGAIGRRDPATGAIQEGSLGGYEPASIAFADDGGLWFVDTDANAIGQVAVDGSLFPAPAPPPGPGPAAPPPVAPRPVAPKRKPSVNPAVASKSLKVAKKRIAVVVSCPKTAKATCSGTVRLRTASKVKVKGRKRKAIVTLSSAGSYKVKRGKKQTVKLKLSKVGRSIVRHGRTTKVSAQLTPKGAKKVVATRKLNLRG